MTWAPFREKWLTRYDTMIRQCRATGRKGRALTIAPRSHGKTEAFISLLTREICLDRNIRTIWVGKTATVAQKRVRRVKSLLLSPRIQADWCTAPELGFGPFLTGKDGRAPGTPSEKWNDNMIVTARQRQSVDATLEAVGVGGAVTGGHFDLALLDDLEDDENVRIASRREALREWLGGTFSPMMDPGSSSLFVGTRKHHDDCYSHMKRDPTYEVIEERAVVKWPEAFEYEYGRDDDGRKIVTGVKAEGAYEVLWPGGRPLSFLLMERLSIGSRLFEREYQGVVQDDSAAPVKWSHLEAAMDAGSFLSFYDVPDVRGLVVVQGWDFALVHDAAQAEASDSDYTVGVTWGKDLDGNRYLLSAVRFRGVAPSRLRQIVQAEFNRWCKLGVRPRFVAVERNNFGELHYLGLRKQTDLPVRPHHTSGKRKADPWDGVPSLAMLFENDKVVLPTGDEDSAKVSRTLCAELWGLGREAHDDMPMALWIAETVLRDLKPTRRFIIGDVEISEQEAILAEQAAAQAEKPPPGKVNRDREREIQASQLWGDLGGIVDGGREVADRLEFESKAGGFSYNG
jgi:phage terminase large subunit-like protein